MVEEFSGYEFLGRGWKFPFRLDSNGKIMLSSGEDDVLESIRIILSTSKGERVMQPDFGCGIHDLVFSSMSTTTIGMIEESVRDALVFYEPRIDVLKVVARSDEARDGLIEINIEYRVRATNNEYNMVYPFYLKE
jgi:phage baseplate assembly protein W